MKLHDYKHIVAIDPGSNGGIVYYDASVEGQEPCVNCKAFPHSMTDFRNFIDGLLGQVGEQVLFVVEDVPKFVAGERTSVASMATLHENFGYIKGIIDANHQPLVLLRPQAWQKAVDAGNRKAYGKRWKPHLKDLAARRFPELGKAITLKTADALLILAAVIDNPNTKKEKEPKQ